MYGDVKLNGYNLRIDLDSWKVRDVIDFAPRASVPGSSVVMSDLSLYQPMVQTDWRRGFGYWWYHDAAGYMSTYGDVDTRQDGLIMRYTQSVASDTNNNPKEGFVNFGGRVYSWGDAGLRYYDPDSDTWAASEFSGIEQAETTQASSASTTLLTYRHTVPSYGQDKLLLVSIALESNVTVTSVTFNGDGLTQANTTGTAPKAQLWYRVAPDDGEHDIVITLASASPVASGATSFLYVDQSTPLGTVATDSGNGTSSSVTVVGATGRLNIGMLAKDGGSADGPAAGETESQSWLQYVSTTVSGGGSYIDSAASVDMTWSWVNARDFVALGVSIIPATTASTGKVNYALNAGDYLFYCPDGGRIRKISTSFVDSVAGLDSSSTDYKWLALHNGYIYAGKDGTNMVHFSSEVDLSDLEGTSADTSVIYVGVGNVATIGAKSYAGNLYVSRADGLYTIGDDAIARMAIDYTTSASADNFKSMDVHAGFLIFPIKNTLVQWNGVRVNPITPSKLNDTFPYTTYGDFQNFIVIDDFLYMTARTNEADYNIHLICYDGSGWHKLSDVDTTPNDITGLGYDTDSNRIWYHSEQASANTTKYIQMQDFSLFPYANFSTSGNHGMLTSRMDMGFRRIKKSMTSLWVEADNVSDTRYISVYYQLDGDGEWHLWDTITDNGITELEYPSGHLTREFNYVQFKFELVTDSTAQSPILTSYTIRFIMRPDVNYGWNFDVVAATNPKDEFNYQELTSQEVVELIRTARDSKSPIPFTDLLGNSTYVYITALTETPKYRRHLADDEVPDVEYSINVNLVGTTYATQ